MAGWRQAVELAMSREELEILTTVSRSRTELASRVSRAQMLLAYRDHPSFCAVGKKLGVHHQTVQRCAEGGSPMARWRHSTTDRGQAKNRRSRRKPRLGWCLWRATKPWTTAIRMNCGRRACWHAMRANVDQLPATGVWRIWSRALCARSSAKRKSSRTRCATILKTATPSSNRRWRRFCASIARLQS